MWQYFRIQHILVDDAATKTELVHRTRRQKGVNCRMWQYFRIQHILDDDATTETELVQRSASDETAERNRIIYHPTRPN